MGEEGGAVLKTSTSEVRCDGCGDAIPVMHPTAIFATLRGPRIGHKKLDACNFDCLLAALRKLPDELQRRNISTF